MRVIMLFSVLISISCASNNSRREPTAVLPPGKLLELSEALQMGAVPAVAHLRSQITAKSFDGLYARDPAAALPLSLRPEKQPKVSKEKNVQFQFIKKFKTWNLAKKTRRAQELTVDFRL
ncbi:MAG: hypothetical protein EOP04_15990 [Proteobacteria bacterium]|nr:MAG: hypothetical protein EOP04_15990 [Pseudomonadota bacterium]